MAPESVMTKARKAMTCHPGASVAVGDPYFIAGHWKVNCFCMACSNAKNLILSEEEHDEMNDKLPWGHPQRDTR